MTCYLAEPPGTPRGGIVMLAEIFGVNAAMRQAAEDFAAEGYLVVVPDLYWRVAPGVALGFGDADRARAIALWQAYNVQRGIEDVLSTAYWLRAERHIDPALLGFGLGGQLAVLAAGRAHPRAVSILFAIRMEETLAELRALTCPIDIHVGDQDPLCPSPTRAAIKRAIGDRPNAHMYVYTDARHGFFHPQRGGAFDKEAAAIAKTRTLRAFQSAFAQVTIT